MEATTEDLKGYDHQFMEPPPDDLLCLICLCVARDPQQINCCGKVLCNGCLQEHENHSSKCPQCRKPITSFADKRSERHILSLKAQCDNSSNGCDWVGELRSMDAHLASCGLTLLPCPNKCHMGGDKLNIVKLLRKDLEKHTEEECPRRQYKCPHCQEDGEYKERTTEHLAKCPMKEIPCPNHGCKTHTARCNLSKHYKDCMFVLVPCKYVAIGCKMEVLRKDLEVHQGDSQQHLQLAIDTVHQQHTIIKEQVCMLAHLRSKDMPIKYKFTDFDQHKTANDTIYSPAFYTSPGGYKMCISVHANGDGEGKGAYVSAYAYLMKGENDDDLPWPFTGKVTIELLNQLEDKNHYSRNMIFPPEEVSSLRVVNKERSRSGWGHRRYISHSNLGYNAAKNCQYLKNDCLYFRISVDAERSSTPWLV